MQNKSPAGWTKVKECTSNHPSSDSGDDKHVLGEEPHLTNNERDDPYTTHQKQPLPYPTKARFCPLPPIPPIHSCKFKQRKEPPVLDSCFNNRQYGHWKSFFPVPL